MKRTKMVAFLLAIAMMFGCTMTVYAQPIQLPDGNVFDAEFYAQTYPEVAAVVGTDIVSLYQHYLTAGKAEGKLPYASAQIEQAAPTPVKAAPAGAPSVKAPAAGQTVASAAPAAVPGDSTVAYLTATGEK